MNNIVLGHSGFIGSHTYKFLKNKGLKVIGGNTKNCNLLNKKDIINFFKKKKFFNLIICSSIVKSKNDTKESYKRNVLMISNLVKLVNEQKINKIIFLSSIDVYKVKGKLNENKSKIKPNTFYGKYKVLAESLLKKYIPNEKLIILRLTGVYDKNIKGRNMISYIKRGLKNRTLNIYSSGEELRDYMNAYDVAKTINFLLKKDANGIYNLATGISKKVKYFVNKLNKKYQLEKKQIFYNSNVRLNDIIIDVNKIKKIISVKNFKKI